MDLNLKQSFMGRWKKYFPDSALPIVFFYASHRSGLPGVPRPAGHQCLIGVLNKVRKGASLCFDVDSLGCAGAKRYLGYARDIRPGFEYFLSCGIEGRMEGERYKKTPAIVSALMADMPDFKAPGRFIVFRRWDQLIQEDHPDVVIFFAHGDVLSGLFTLAGFAQADPIAVVMPFAAGCGSIVQYPFLEKQKDNPRAVLGMFDVSARPYVGPNELSFAIPMEKFEAMVADMDESFLITKSWQKVKGRLGAVQ